MAHQAVMIKGEDNIIYRLPEGVTFETFNWGRTQAILREGVGGAFENGAAVVDSFDIRRPPEGLEPREAVRQLLVRNGAKPVPANA